MLRAAGRGHPPRTCPWWLLEYHAAGGDVLHRLVVWRMAVVVHGWWRHCSLVTALLLCLRVSDGYWSRWWSVARPRWCSKVLFWLRSAKFWWVVLGSPGTAHGCLQGIPACGVADLGGQREALGCVQSYLHRYGFVQPFWYVIHGTLWNFLLLVDVSSSWWHAMVFSIPSLVVNGELYFHIVCVAPG